MALLSLGNISNDITYPLIGGGVGLVAGLVLAKGSKASELYAAGGAVAGAAAGWIVANTIGSSSTPKITVSVSTITLYNDGTYGPTALTVSGTGFSTDTTTNALFWLVGTTYYAIGPFSSGLLGNISPVPTFAISAFSPTVGSGYIVAQDGNTGVYSNQVPITIKAGGTPPPSGGCVLTASVSSLTGLPANITVGGSGYYDGETDIALHAYYNGNAENVVTLGYSQINPGPQGDFSFVPVAIPAISGATSISIYADGLAGTTNTITIPVNSQPPSGNAQISVSPTTVPSAMGNVLTISGSGFNADSPITIYASDYVNGQWGARTIIAQNVSSGPLGNFGNTPLTIYQVSLPSLPGATAFMIFAADATGRASPGVEVSVQGIKYTPQLIPNIVFISKMASAITVSTFSVTGQGFPNSSTIAVSASSSTVPSTTLTSNQTITDSSGGCTVSWTFPSGGLLYTIITLTPAGNYVTITVTAGGVSASCKLLVLA